MEFLRRTKLQSAIGEFLKASEELNNASKRSRQGDTEVANSVVNSVIGTMNNVVKLLQSDDTQQDIDLSISSINQGLQNIQDSSRDTAAATGLALKVAMKELRSVMTRSREKIDRVKGTSFEQLDKR